MHKQMEQKLKLPHAHTDTHNKKLQIVRVEYESTAYRTMVVEYFNTILALTAVFGSGRSIDITSLAILPTI